MIVTQHDDTNLPGDWLKLTHVTSGPKWPLAVSLTLTADNRSLTCDNSGPVGPHHIVPSDRFIFHPDLDQFRSGVDPTGPQIDSWRQLYIVITTSCSAIVVPVSTSVKADAPQFDSIHCLATKRSVLSGCSSFNVSVLKSWYFTCPISCKEETIKIVCIFEVKKKKNKILEAQICHRPQLLVYQRQLWFSSVFWPLSTSFISGKSS
jgi:hypothetical protein